MLHLLFSHLTQHVDHHSTRLSHIIRPLSNTANPEIFLTWEWAGNMETHDCKTRLNFRRSTLTSQFSDTATVRTFCGGLDDRCSIPRIVTVTSASNIILASIYRRCSKGLILALLREHSTYLVHARHLRETQRGTSSPTYQHAAAGKSLCKNDTQTRAE